MRQRPLVAVCLFWIGAILLARLLGLPLFGEPKLTSAQRSLLQQGVSANVCGTVLDCQVSERTVCYTLQQVEVLFEGQAHLFPKLLLYDDANSEPLKPGTVLAASGKLTPIEAATNPGQFDAAAHYGCRRIYYKLWAEERGVKEYRKTLRGTLFSCRTKMTHFLETEMHKESAGILSAMLLGDRTVLDEESRLNFQIGGCLHLLVISGLHVSLLGSFVLRLFLRLRLPRSLAAALTAGSMLLYTALIGWAIAAVRACLMFLLRLLALALGRTYDSANALAASALLMLCKEPGYLFSSGFQLSYAASIGAALVAPKLQHALRRRQKARHGEAILSWIAIQICTLPLLAYYFYELPVFGLPLNLLLIPLMPILLVWGAGGVLTGMILPRLGSRILYPLDGVLLLLQKLLATIRKLPGSSWICGAPSLWQVAVCYGLLLLASVLVLQSRQKPVCEHETKHSFLSRKGRWSALFLFLACGVLFLRPVPAFSLTMLDVGQGDCIVLRKRHTVFLSDGGSTNVSAVGKNRILPYLKSQGIDTVDTVFLSHDDEDHVSGIEEWLLRITKRETNVRLQKVAMPQWMAQTETGERIRILCQQAKVQVLWLARGDCLQSGTLRMEVLHPFRQQAEEGEPIGGVQSGNGGSLVLWIGEENFSALLTGDLEKEGEEELLPYLADVDCLKVGHHGSRWSTSEAFLKKTRPEIALISAPVNSPYGHPHAETLDRLAEVGATIFATKDGGAITLEIRRKEVVVREFLKK